MVGDFVRWYLSCTGLSPGQLILHVNEALNILCKGRRSSGSVCRRDHSIQLHGPMVAIDRHWISIGDALVGERCFHLSNDESIVRAFCGRIVMMRRGRLYGVVLQFNGLSSRRVFWRSLLRLNADCEDGPGRDTPEHGGY